jgi:hypothetical protein
LPVEFPNFGAAPDLTPVPPGITGLCFGAPRHHPDRPLIRGITEDASWWRHVFKISATTSAHHGLGRAIDSPSSRRCLRALPEGQN